MQHWLLKQRLEDGQFVQKQHTTKIPKIKERIKVKQQFLIPDKTKFLISDHINKNELMKITRHRAGKYLSSSFPNGEHTPHHEDFYTCFWNVKIKKDTDSSILHMLLRSHVERNVPCKTSTVLPSQNFFNRPPGDERGYHQLSWISLTNYRSPKHVSLKFLSSK